MILLLGIWTLDTLFISTGLENMNQIFLLCFKTICSLPVLIIFLTLKEGFHLPSKKGLPLLFLSSILGNILYFYFEYTAFKYLPISIASLMLGLMPALSYLADSLILHQRLSLKIFIMILFSLFGLTLVLYDGDPLDTGTMIGYISCFICVIIWIIYGNVLQHLNKYDDSTTITLYESLIASIIMLPLALSYKPEVLSFHDLYGSIILMGILSTGFGYLIEVKGLIDLGTTISGIYVNFLPVSTAIIGFLFLHESLTILQIIGALIVIISGLFVIIWNE